MRFSNFFTTALAASMPVAAIAKTTPNAYGAASNLLTRDEFAQFAKIALTPRQETLDLGDALSNLLDLLKELQSFLTADFLGDVHTVVTGLADLLEAPFANTTRGIVFTAADALGQVDLGALIGQISPLLDTLGKLDIGGLVDAASGLLTPDNIKIIGNLLNGANSLLTQDFIDETKQLIADAQPVRACHCYWTLVLDDCSHVTLLARIGGFGIHHCSHFRTPWRLGYVPMKIIRC